MKTFVDLSKEYAGRKLKENFEEAGNAVLVPYGLEIIYGDHQIMVLTGHETYQDEEDFTCYACIMYSDEDNPVIDNIHMEPGSRYPMEKYDLGRYNLTDAEYGRGIRIMEELLTAVTE